MPVARAILNEVEIIRALGHHTCHMRGLLLPPQAEVVVKWLAPANGKMEARVEVIYDEPPKKDPPMDSGNPL